MQDRSERKSYILRRIFIALIGLLVLGGAALQANAALPPASVASPSADALAQSKEANNDPWEIADYDCANLEQDRMEMRMSKRAAAIVQKCRGNVTEKAAENTIGIEAIDRLLAPLAYGGADKQTITGGETFPKVTQSETFTWGNGAVIVVTYNDSRDSSGSPQMYSGISVSTDSGATFTRLLPAPFTGLGSNFGDPVVFWSARAGKWYYSSFATNCGGQGIGQWESTNPNALTWTSSGCVHNGASDDRFSGWVDNNPASPNYGTQYISWNNFAVGGGALQVTRSTNDGATWSAAFNVTSNFIRNVQMTGDPISGHVFIAGMDEMGGGLTNRANKMYRSTDGGVTWANTYTGPTFPGPGRGASGFFATMYPNYWRHMGWGQPGAYNGVVHYVYGARNTGNGDPGNVFYIRSTDNGVTFSAPLQMNTDAGTRANWQANLSVGTGGTVFVGWYDERSTASCGSPGVNTPCYERYGRASLDNGLTWQTDQVVSDVVSPLPAQPDTAVQSTYAGDYDYATANGTQHLQAWVDGRVLVSGTSQQDVFFDAITLGGGTPTPTVTGTPPTATRTNTVPTATNTTCVANYSVTASTGATIVPGTTLAAGSNCDDCSVAIPLPFAFNFYGQSFNSVNAISNGNLQFSSTDTAWTNTCLPDANKNNAILAYWDDMLLTTAGDGIYTSTSGSAPNRIFNIEWRGCYYSGGVCGARISYEARLYEGTGQIDVIYALVSNGNTSATGGVQNGTGSTFLQAYCNGSGLAVTAGTMHRYTQGACGSVTPATNTSTSTATATTGGGSATATCVPGGTPGPWTAAASYTAPIGRYGFAQTATDFYVISGVSSGTIVNTVSRYNIAAGTWTALAPVPVGTEAPACAVLAGKIYCGGGYDGGFGTTLFQIYDIATNAWTAGPAMPSAAWGAAAGAFGGKVYIVGGDFPSTTTTRIFDVATSTWSTGTAIPAAYVLGAYNTVGQYLYAVGSFTAAPQAGVGSPSLLSKTEGASAPDANSTGTYRLDMSTGAWTTGPAFTTGRADAALASDGTKLFVIGGDNTGGGYFDPSSAVDELSLAAWPGGSWVASPPNLTSSARQGNQAGFNSAGRIWSTGGIGPGAAFLTLHEYRTTGSGGCVTPVTSTPTATTGSGSATATCAPGGGPIIVNGELSSTDPTLATRLFRADPANTCAAPQPYEGTSGTGPFYYDTHTYPNTTGSSTCVLIDVDPGTCTGTPFIHASAYLNTFDPNNLQTNYLGDIGASPTGPVQFSVTVPAGQSVVVVVNAVTAGAAGACPGYTLTIDGLGGGGCQTPGTNTPVVTVSPTGTCVPSGGGVWTPNAPIPANLVRYGFAQVGDNFYVVSGVADGFIVNDVRKYDAATDTWSTLAPIPAGSEGGSCAYNGGTNKIYCAFGDGGNSFHIYDIATNAWSAGPAVPGPATRYGAAMGSFGTNVYIAGGDASASTDVQVFNTTTNTWSAGTAAPTGFFLSGYNSVGQYLYVVGGFTGVPQEGAGASSVTGRSKNVKGADAPDANNTTTMRLDMSAGTWSSGPAWTAGRADFGLAHTGGVLYALGGDAQGGGFFDSVTTVDELNVTAWPGGSWAASPPALPSPPRQANQAGFTSTDGAIWSTGGINGSTFQFLNENLSRGGGCAPTTTTPVTSTSTSTSTATSGTPGATCTPSAGGWSAGANLPTTLTRAQGTYFQPNGKFYAIGGRTGDGDPALAQLNPLEYDPTANTWTQKNATFPNLATSNVQGGVLTLGGQTIILVVGGSEGGGTSGVTDTRVFDPVADTITVLASDPWTPGTTTLPGGVVVVNNKLYVLGGFEINVGMTSAIWEFDPAASAGSRWTLQTATLPTALGYIPTAAIGTDIYTIGGSEWDGSTLVDSAVAFKYDTVADTITTIASTPRATGETRALAYGGDVWVFGGGRVSPNPGNQVEIYDPTTNTYSAGPSFVGARRNFPIDTDGTRIWLAGGYDIDGVTLLNSMEIYTPGGGCTPTATPSATSGSTTPTNTSTNTSTSTSSVTNTSTATTGTGTPSVTETAGTATATATSTACVLQFTDVEEGSTFYEDIRCLACRGIINGYSTGCETGNPCFRPGNLVTRGQLAKIASNSAGFFEPVGSQQYEDVLPGSTFYDFIWRLTQRGLVNGYPCGGPGGPCGDPALPYFRPASPVTRGQLTKIVANAAGLTEPVTGQQYEDVPPGHTFYEYIGRLTALGVINGYPCGGLGEPCGDPALPYFRPGANATRGQASKIVANTFFPGCVTPFEKSAPSKSGLPNN